MSLRCIILDILKDIAKMVKSRLGITRRGEIRFRLLAISSDWVGEVKGEGAALALEREWTIEDNPRKDAFHSVLTEQIRKWSALNRIMIGKEVG